LTQLLGDIDDDKDFSGVVWNHMHPQIQVLIDLPTINRFLPQKRFSGFAGTRAPSCSSWMFLTRVAGVKRLMQQMKARKKTPSFRAILAMLMGPNITVVYATPTDLVAKKCLGTFCSLNHYTFDLSTGNPSPPTRSTPPRPKPLSSGKVIQVQVLGLSSPEPWELLRGPVDPFKLLMQGQHHDCEMVVEKEEEPSSPYADRGLESRETQALQEAVFASQQSF
jgi:hypothetical protein